MQTYIALLRGINVSGKNKIKMQELREQLATFGYQNIQTYIQSGNIILESSENEASIQAQIHHLIAKHWGFDVPVLVRTADYWNLTTQNNPYLAQNANLDIKYLHVTFLEDTPTIEALAKLVEKDTGTEELTVVDDQIYLYYPNGYGKAKMTNNALEKILGVRATTRNWKTCMKLTDLAQ